MLRKIHVWKDVNLIEVHIVERTRLVSRKELINISFLFTTPEAVSDKCGSYVKYPTSKFVRKRTSLMTKRKCINRKQ